MSLINFFFEKYSGLDLGLDLDRFSSRSRTLGLEIFRSRSWSWSRKNFPVSVSVSVSRHVVSTTSLAVMMHPRNDRFHLIVRIAAKQVIVRLIILLRQTLEKTFGSKRVKSREDSLLVFFTKNLNHSKMCR